MRDFIIFLKNAPYLKSNRFFVQNYPPNTLSVTLQIKFKYFLSITISYQKPKLNKIHIAVPRQQYCVLTRENKNPMQQLQKPSK